MSAPPRRRCLVVRCGDPEPAVAQRYGCFAAWFREAMHDSVEMEVVDPRADVLSPTVLEDVGAVVISGSPHAVYEPHPWIPGLEVLVREAVSRRNLPLLGVCFGHQLLAQTFGGEVARNPRGREMGTITVDLNEHGRTDALFRTLATRFTAQATHRDTVLRPPPGARVLASSLKDGCQAFALGRRAWGVQFHPEITAGILKGYVRARHAVLREEGTCPDTIHDAIVEADGRAVLSNFLSLAFDGGLAPTSL